MPYLSVGGNLKHNGIILACYDATALTAVPQNHSVCSSLAQPCAVKILLTLPAPPKHPGSLQAAASLISIWQAGTSIFLFGQWGAQGLSAVLQHAHCIKYLYAVKIGVNSPSSDIFVNLTSLRTLILEGNSISSVPADDFATMTKLVDLFLYNNGLRALPPQLFRDCPQLAVLDLQKNKLTKLDPGIFTGLGALEKLDVSANQLIHLPGGIFQDQSKLATLFINNNKLVDVDVTIVMA